MSRLGQVFSLTALALLCGFTAGAQFLDLPSGIVGVPYTTDALTGYVNPPIEWVLEAGQLPPGLAIDSQTAVIIGVPQQTGTFTFRLAIDGSRRRDDVTVRLRITIDPAPTPPSITTSSLPPGTVGKNYWQAIAASGGSPPYSWSATGSFPPGLTLNTSTGEISGIPDAAGSYSFNVKVSDVAGTTNKDFVISVVAALAVASESPLPGGTTGSDYSYTLAASGGTPPYRWKIQSGALPSGLSLEGASGKIAGKPTSSGNFNFTAQVEDENGSSAQKQLAVSINSSLAFVTPAELPVASPGVRYSYTLSASGGAPPYVFKISSGSLPGGLSLSSEGVISGTPSQIGASEVTIEVADSTSAPAKQKFTIAVESALEISTPSPLPNGFTGRAYTQTLATNSGSPPYKWQISSGSLPPGLTLNASEGTITGLPTSAGTFWFFAAVTDSASASATREYSLRIEQGLAITNPAALPAASAGKAYNHRLTAVGGSAPYAWSITSGTLPSGLALNATTGSISGTPSAAGSFTFTVQVIDNERIAESRQFTLPVSLEPVPPLSISGAPESAAALQQPAVNVVLGSTYTVPVTGRLTIGFTSDAAVPVDDPAVQFSTGGRTVEFTIPPNTIQAVFPVPMLAVQTGSVAGTITITANLQAAGVAVPEPVQRTIRVESSAPVIRNLNLVRNETGLEVWITGFSPSREITQAKFLFTPAPESGIPPVELTIPLDESSRNWFTSPASQLFGSQFTLVQPFIVQKNIDGIDSVAVTLSNRQGTSQPMEAK